MQHCTQSPSTAVIHAHRLAQPCLQLLSRSRQALCSGQSAWPIDHLTDALPALLLSDPDVTQPLQINIIDGAQ